MNLNYLDHEPIKTTALTGKPSIIVQRMRNAVYAKNEKLTPDNIADDSGIPEPLLVKWIDKEMNDEKACLTLPAALLCFLTFCFMLREHWGQQFRYGKGQQGPP